MLEMKGLAKFENARPYFGAHLNLCEEFQNQDVYFSEFENDCYEGASLQHLYRVLSGYKEQLPVLYGEVKKAYELDALAILCL